MGSVSPREARELRTEKWLQGLLLVALTVYSDDEHKRRAAEAGFDLHTTKPVSLSKLNDLLARLSPQLSGPSQQ